MICVLRTQCIFLTVIAEGGPVSFTLAESGRDDAGTLSEKSAGAGHRAVSLHRDCVLVFLTATSRRLAVRFRLSLTEEEE